LTQPGRDHLAIGVVVTLVLAFYVWTAGSGTAPIRFGKDEPDYYNQLTDAFLRGQTSLQRKPNPGLLTLPDPYDPAANERYRFPPNPDEKTHDLSLYHGRFYLYWGPTPVLTLYLPWRLLPLGELSQSLAAAIFSGAGFLFALGFLRLLQRRYAPNAPLWSKLVAVVAVGLGNLAPYMLRRPEIYETAIAAGYCFLFAGLWLMAAGATRAPPSWWRVGAGSLCLGAAVGARPDLGVVAGLLATGLVLALWLTGRLPDPRETLRAATAALAPLAVCVVVLLAYNAVRFDSPTEFGQRYQLAGVEVAKQDRYDLAFLPPGLYFYLFAPPRLTVDFPFVKLPPPPGYPGTLPAGYNSIEPTGGILPSLPIVLFCGGLFALRRRHGEAALVGGALAVGGLLTTAVVAWALFGVSQRYEMDFAPLLLVAALLAWLVLRAAAAPRRRRVLDVLAVVAVAWGSAIALATSLTGLYDGLRAGQPGTYKALDDLTAFVPEAAADIAGRPIVTEVRSPDAFVTAPETDYLTLGQGPVDFHLGPAPVRVEIFSPDDRQLFLQARLAPEAAVDPRTRLTVQALTSRSAAGVPVNGGTAQIPIALRAGRNEVTLSAALVPSRRGAPPPQPPWVAVTGLQIPAHSGTNLSTVPSERERR
jgi:hypothetical protein